MPLFAIIKIPLFNYDFPIMIPDLILQRLQGHHQANLKGDLANVLLTLFNNGIGSTYSVRADIEDPCNTTLRFNLKKTSTHPICAR
ncbi:hypothetical protein GCM10011409_07230 [Lentibacillus populi]|uniref:Uncharacterized protein n=1 Tax=Lentibacillus populi TaxID=1827502 RepID=A0A9W5TVI1_9BACI|nr:hypothetical protein GCM10011409_07230 [Lentibacillus populi]